MNYTRLSREKRSRIVHCFAEDVPASIAAKLVLVNRKTVNTWYRELRLRMLPEASKLPEIPSPGQFAAFHKRRIAKFNGLSKASNRLFLIDSRLRYQLKVRFRTVLIDAAAELLD